MDKYLNFAVDWSNSENVSAFDELPLWSAIFGDLLLKHVPLRTNITVLDVGCGTGFPLLELAQRLGSSCAVHGVDPWATALERARFKANTQQVDNVQCHEADAVALPFPDGQFDLIVSNLGINNFSDAPATLRECFRVAKPGATLALTTNLQGHMHEFYATFEVTLRELGQTGCLESLRAHVAHRATVPGTTALLKSAGFRVVRVLEETACMRFTNGSALLHHYFIKIGFLDAWKQVVPPDARPEVFAALESHLNELARVYGELRLTIPMAYFEARR